MKRYELTVATRRLFLESAEAADRARSDIVDALRRGGDFIDVSLVDQRTTAVLITERTVAFIDAFDLDDDDPEGTPLNVFDPDFDF
ncbi:MAG: hypothetical protein HY996_09930 [Micrococcales bacterium]|nr:hypothetical protein [Micrococcales bacterium]